MTSATIGPPLEHDLVATFRTRKGSFWLADEVIDDPDRFAYEFASRMPDEAEATSVREDGGRRFTWRVITTTIRRADGGRDERS